MTDFRVSGGGLMLWSNSKYAGLAVPRQSLLNIAPLQYETTSASLTYLVADMGGSISAEHGIGQLKRDELVRYKDPVELALMRAIKQAVDPRGLMNPGKLL